MSAKVKVAFTLRYRAVEWLDERVEGGKFNRCDVVSECLRYWLGGGGGGGVCFSGPFRRVLISMEAAHIAHIDMLVKQSGFSRSDLLLEVLSLCAASPDFREPGCISAMRRARIVDHFDGERTPQKSALGVRGSRAR